MPEMETLEAFAFVALIISGVSTCGVRETAGRHSTSHLWTRMAGSRRLAGVLMEYVL
jgi:hypothetical protein